MGGSCTDARAGTARSVGVDVATALVQRVVESERFRRAPKLRDLLIYLCECALRGETGELCEQRIGSKVFDRVPDYDTSADNIVRVEARRLRERLDAHFANEGAGEPLIVSIPRGGYVPIFVQRAQAEPSAPGTPAPVSEVHRRRAWLGAVPWVMAALLGVATAVLWASRNTVPAANERRLSDPAVLGLWARMFEPGRDLTIVLADSNFALLQDITRRKIPLKDYAGRKYLPKLLEDTGSTDLASALSLIDGKASTPLADAHLCTHIVQIANQLRMRSTIRLARNVGLRDLRGSNLVVIGDAHSNPWAELFHSRLNFVVDYDPTLNRELVLNRKPRAGEQPVYMSQAEPETHAVAALITQSDGRGKVLLLSGATTEGTEACGDFFLNPETCTRLRRALGLSTTGHIPSFEVLLGLETVAGAGRTPRILAYRSPGI